MAKATAKPNLPAVQKVQPSATALSRPDYLNRPVIGTDDLKQFVVLPRLKVLQKQASSDLLRTYNIGDLILTPTMQMVLPFPTEDNGKVMDVERGRSFFFTPLYFFVNWVTLNPLGVQNLPVVRYITSNPADPIVAKSRSKELRFETCPECPNDPQKRLRHSEQLNFVVKLQNGHELGDVPFILTLSRGDHFSGSKFCTLIQQRKASPFECVFEAFPTRRKSPQGDWWGLDVCNPSDENISPWVTAEEAEQYAADFEQYRTLFEANKLRADETDLNEPGLDADPTAAAAKEKTRF